MARPESAPGANVCERMWWVVGRGWWVVQSQSRWRPSERERGYVCMLCEGVTLMVMKDEEGKPVIERCPCSTSHL